MNINPNTNEALSLFHSGILAFARAERAGLRVDVNYVNKKMEYLTRKMTKLEKEFKESTLFKHWQHSIRGTINIHSNPQLEYYLYKVKKIKVEKETQSGRGATDDESLRQMNIPELDILLRIRKLKKTRDTYLEAFIREQVDGYMHTNLNLHFAVSYRSSSDSPNLHNIPVRDEDSMQMCRGALYPRPGHQILEIDFKGIEVSINACVIGSTKIETIDGSQSIKKIINRLNRKEKVYVYGYDKSKRRICVSKVTDGGLTKTNAEIWKIILDNGETIYATPDHKIMLRNGYYIPLQNLKAGDSLMPFYKRKKVSAYKTVYEEVYLNNGQKILAHNLIAKDVRGIQIGGTHRVVHHKNGNGCDNSLKNTPILTRKDHMKIHSVQGWKNKPKREHWFDTEEGKKFVQNHNKERKEIWTDKDWKEFGQHVSDGIKRNGGRHGERNSMFGKSPSKKSRDKNSKAHKGSIPWNKGLTKETNSILREYGKRISKTKKEKGGKVRCMICKKEFVSLSESHLYYKHNIGRKEYKATYNHKVVSVKFERYENVYNINVKGIHNYALSSGIIIKNCYNKDPRLIKYVSDPTTDMHGDMAKQIFKVKDFDKHIKEHYTLRQAAKNSFVFPEFYGDYYKHCSGNLLLNWGKLNKGTFHEGEGIPMPEGTLGDHLIDVGLGSFNRFEKHLKVIEDDFWHNRFPVYSEWKEKWYASYKKYGYFDLLTGFRCGGIMDKKQACNYPGQGTAFHCLLWSFIQLDERMRRESWDTRLVNQIHDSAILDVHPDELEHVIDTAQEITTVRLAEHFPWINTPMKVDMSLAPVDKAWSEKEEI